MKGKPIDPLEEAFPTHDIEDIGENARDAVTINGADLRSALERLPVDLAHYGFEFARAHRRWIAAKMTYDEARAVSYISVRADLENLGHKVTEAIVDAGVTKDPRVQTARAEHIEAEFLREQMRAMVEALRAKREALTSLSLMARAELSATGGYRDIPE